jgi:UDP-N-acetylmuramate--alanine ligase
MTLTDLSGKKIHFIGIGGVSMSGIAAYFASIGMKIQGSDAAINDSKYIDGFAEKNIKLFNGQLSENITPDVDLIIKTSTVKDDNPEIMQAKQLNIPIIDRFDAVEMIISQFKTKIAISGSSGKTTTTALVWQALCNQAEKPSCIIGTVLKEFSSSIFVNEKSDYCVIEADESDGMFADLQFNIAIITDIDADHLDHKRYQNSRDKLIEHFEIFVSKTLSNGGIVIYNINCKTTTELMAKYLNTHQGKIFSYSGLELVLPEIVTNHAQGDIYLESVKNTQNGLEFSCKGISNIQNINIPMIGKINAFNALPAILLAKNILNLSANTLFEKFQGAQKRCEIIGTTGNITIIDDYAHSPKKIKAFLQGFVSYTQDIHARCIFVCEPHKYTRVASLYQDYITCFDSCDNLILMPIFGIQGRDIDSNISSENLSQDIQTHWNYTKNQKKRIKYLKNNNELLSQDTFKIYEDVLNIDNKPFSGKLFYVFLGAGFSSKYAHLLYHSLSKK